MFLNITISVQTTGLSCNKDKLQKYSVVNNLELEKS